MTIVTTATSSGPYTATADDTFAVTFQSAGDDEIMITLDGVAVNPADYTFTRDDDGTGEVVFTTPVTGEVWIYSDPDFQQDTEFQRFGAFFPDMINTPLDRIMARVLWLRERVAALFPDAARVAADRAGQYVAFDSDGNPVLSSGTGADDGLRTDLAASTGGSLISFINGGDGAIARSVQTKMRELEIAPEDYGALGDTVEGSGTTLTGTNDDAAFSAAAVRLTLQGGGTLKCVSGKVYRLTQQITVPSGVRFNLNEAKLVFELSSANACGVQVRSNTIVENGHIRIISSGSPASQAGAHAPVRVGPLYGSGGTVASPSADDNVSNWEIRNLILESNKDLGAVATGGAAGIQIVGNAYSGIIQGITIPDSTTMSIGIALDWGTRGEVSGTQAIVSSAASMGSNKTNFNNGDGFTTHPHKIQISGVAIGRLERAYGGTATTGTHGVRLSACWGIEVSNVLVSQTTEAAFCVHAGDLGFEFAKDSDLTHAMHGITFRNCHVDNASTGNVVQCDSTADNVQTAITSFAYTSLHTWSAKWPSGMEFRGVGGTRTSGTAAYGFNLYNLDGCRLVDCRATGFLNNLRFSGASKVAVEGGRFTSSSGSSIKFEDSSSDIRLKDMRECHTAGAGLPVVYLGLCDKVTIDGGVYGRASGETGTYTLQAVDGSCTNLSVINQPEVLGHGSGGSDYAVAMGNTNSNLLLLYTGVKYGSSVTRKYAGQSFRPHVRFGDGVLHATGDGTPEGSLTASPGSICTRTNGGAGLTLYVKQTGTGNTGWAGIA